MAICIVLSEAMKMTTVDDVACNCKRRGMSTKEMECVHAPGIMPRFAVPGYAH